jgi:hypothetical protein
VPISTSGPITIEAVRILMATSFVSRVRPSRDHLGRTRMDEMIRRLSRFHACMHIKA